MTHVTISGSRSPLREADLRALEQRLGITLPLEYRNFLLQHNGGHPTPNVFSIAACPIDDQGVLTQMLSISDGEETLLNYVDMYADRIPPNLLPIGFDPGSNLICISVSGADRGNVYFWAHDFEASEDEGPNYDNVYFVADNFDHLINNLTHLPDISARE